MDHYQGVVEDYLRADRSVFVNPEFCLQLSPSKPLSDSGTMWHLDHLAVDMRRQTAFLCEVAYAHSLAAMVRRLATWSEHWDEIEIALERDACIPKSFAKRPWVFIPANLINAFLRRYSEEVLMGFFDPLVTPLEMTAPWSYCTWNRIGEASKDGYGIPPEMRSLEAHGLNHQAAL